MVKDTTVTAFLENEYSNSALYMNYRSNPSYIDGLKNSGRKVVYVMKKKNLSEEAKVSQFASTVAAESGYIHGDASLQGTLVTLAQDFRGANNLPIVKGVGSFGTAFMNEASAARYIFIKPQPYFELLFRNADEQGLVKQNFEGEEIEPRYYVPTLPNILINGCTGIGVGFACKILARNPKYIMEAIRRKLNNIPIDNNLFVPGWNGFKGYVNKISDIKWEICGVASINKKKVTIEELPIGYELQQYISILKKLKEKGIVVKYEDFSEDDNYNFVVTLSDEEAKKDFNDILEDLKLKITITESLTCIDENNAIVEFKNANDLFDRYFDFKMSSLEIRLKNEIDRLEKEMSELKEIYDFINMSIQGKIDFKAPRKVLETQVESFGFTLIQKLISMPLYSLTKEKAEEAKSKYENKLKELEDMKKETPKSLWEKDLKLIEKYI